MAAGPTREISLEEVGSLLEGAEEVARVWIRRGGQNTFLIQPEPIQEPFAFGMLLVDMMKHGAMAFAQASGCDATEAFNEISEGFFAELENPTDTVEGSVH